MPTCAYSPVTGLDHRTRILGFRKKGGELYGPNCSNMDR
jgi:hypothetical protein